MSFMHGKLPIMAAGILLAATMASASTPATNQSAKLKAKSKIHLHRASRHSSKKSRKPRGQQAIDNSRAQQIQQALVREHYLTGEPSGTWDAATQQALRRYQADQGWQSKTVPDSRALIRLGLGPSREHLLNPESAMVSGSVPVQSARANSANAVSHSSMLGSQGSTASTPVSSGNDLASSR